MKKIQRVEIQGLKAIDLRTYTLRLTPELGQTLELRAKTEKKSINYLLTELIEKELKRSKK